MEEADTCALLINLKSIKTCLSEYLHDPVQFLKQFYPGVERISRSEFGPFKIVASDYFAMQTKLSYISLSLILLSAFLLKNVMDLLKWKEQFDYGLTPVPERNVQETIEVTHIESNCGIQYACPVESFPVYLSTGTGAEYPPRLCISGKHLIAPDTAGNRRGLNAAIVEPLHFEIVAVRSFNRSTDVESWLCEMLDNDILIVFTSDEASLKLTTELVMLFNDLGSGMVHNIRFRSQWFMITQKGTSGFTVYEKITFSKNKNWGEMIDFRSCIPRKIPKQRTVADDTLYENKLRTRFCSGKKTEEYKGFCQESRFELVIPALLTNRSLIGNPAYSSPLFLYASDDFELLTASLDSLLHQPGVFIPLITVLHEEHQIDVPHMAQIYGMKTLKITFAKNFLDKLNQARKISAKEHPQQPFVIVIDQNVLLSPDFLFFMAQTIQTIKNDLTVSAISAWSCNCYAHEGNVHLAYRVEGTPKYATLVPVKPRSDFFGEFIVPDVPRIQGPEACHLPSLEADNWISRPQDLTKERYFHKLVMLQQLGAVVDLQTLLSNCSVTVLKSDVNTVYFSYDEKVLSNIVYCLGVQEDRFGIYEGIIRLTVSEKIVLIISSESTFYRSRPIALALTKDGFGAFNDTDLSYRTPFYFNYERGEKPRIPNVEVSKPFAISDTYSTMYSSSYYYKPVTRDPISLLKKPLSFATDIPKMTHALPAEVARTEYSRQYLEKPLPESVKGFKIDYSTACPMILTGKDEREAVPLTNNSIAKYLDIYLSTSRQDYRKYSEREQKSIAKDVVSTLGTVDILKGKVCGARTPALAGQDLEKRDRNMMDPIFSSKEFKLRQAHKVLPMVPRYDLKTEYSSSYVEPRGFARRHVFDSFVEYPERNTMSASQAVCSPGAYHTEYDAINEHASPQRVA